MNVDECLANVRWVKHEHGIWMLNDGRPHTAPLFRAQVLDLAGGYWWCCDIITGGLGEVSKETPDYCVSCEQAQEQALATIRAMLEDLHPRLLEVPA